MAWAEDLFVEVLGEFADVCLARGGLDAVDFGRFTLVSSPEMLAEKRERNRAKRASAAFRAAERWQEWDREWMRKLSADEQELYLAAIGPERGFRVRKHWLGRPV